MNDNPSLLITALLAHPGVFRVLSGKDRGDFVKALRKYEWSVGGNGQCPLCYGSRFQTAEYRPGNPSEGHREGCVLAKAMEALGIRHLRSHPLSEETCRRAIRRNRLEMLLVPGVRNLLESCRLAEQEANASFVDPLLSDNPYLSLFDQYKNESN